MRIRIAFAALGLGLALATSPARAEDSAAAKEIHVDIPVALATAKVVFNVDHAGAMAGDQPIALTYMARLLENFRANHTDGKLVAVFHNTMGYLLLNDAAFDAVRHTSHGNPYKEQIAALIRDGVGIEQCAVTMKGNGWGNADLLPGVKVVVGATPRIVQLVQDGYVQIEP